MKISVIIPVYNAEAHLRRCLDSVAGQTYKNLEILLIDDGSTDQSGAICDEYAATDSRFTVIRTENRGVCAARNTGLSAATGDLIGWVDADDWLEKDHFSYLLSLLEDADVAQCAAEAGGEILFTDTLSHSLWNKLYRKDAVSGLSVDADLPIGEDYVFNARVLQKAHLKIGPAAKYHYTVDTTSSSHRTPTLPMLESICRASRRAYALHRKHSPYKNFYRREVLLNDLDVCSKIVRFPREEFCPLRKFLRKKGRLHTFVALTLPTMTYKDRAKYLLMAWCWPLYRKLLLKSKETEG